MDAKLLMEFLSVQTVFIGYLKGSTRTYFNKHEAISLWNGNICNNKSKQNIGFQKRKNTMNYSYRDLVIK